MFYYNKTLGGRHFINATLGMNAKETSSESEQMRFLGFGLGGINSPLFAAGQPDKTKISTSKNRLVFWVLLIIHLMTFICLMLHSVLMPLLNSERTSVGLLSGRWEPVLTFTIMSS